MKIFLPLLALLLVATLVDATYYYDEANIKPAKPKATPKKFEDTYVEPHSYGTPFVDHYHVYKVHRNLAAGGSAGGSAQVGATGSTAGGRGGQASGKLLLYYTFWFFLQRYLWKITQFFISICKILTAKILAYIFYNLYIQTYTIAGGRATASAQQAKSQGAAAAARQEAKVQGTAKQVKGQTKDKKPQVVRLAPFYLLLPERLASSLSFYLD